MATKTYQSKSDISISVLMEDKSTHVSFSPITGTGSIFTTDNVKLQAAIEKHHNFGKLFTLREETRVEKVKKERKSGGVEKVCIDEKDIDNGNEMTVVEVSCPEDAKEYLADKFEVSRTSMKSVKAIKDIAAVHHIEFAGI